MDEALGADARVAAESIDLHDGTHETVWRSEATGSFVVHVLIDGVHIDGSPATLRLSSTRPDLGRTEVSGVGRETAMAGKPSQVDIRFVDRFAPDAVRGALAELVRREAVYVPVNASILALELLSGALMFAPQVAWAAVAGAMLLHAVLSLISFYDFAAVAFAVLYLIVPIAEHDRCAPRRARGRLPGPCRPRRWGTAS